MSGKFPMEETPHVVVLVHQLINAIFQISWPPIQGQARIKPWKSRFGAKAIRRLIDKKFETKSRITDDDASEIFQAIMMRLKPSRRKQFESRDTIPIKDEFVRRLRVLRGEKGGPI